MRTFTISSTAWPKGLVFYRRFPDQSGAVLFKPGGITMHAMQNVAVMAARRGGDSLIRNLVKLEKLKVEKKGRNDFVSEADVAAEQAVISVIHKHYPDHAILAEESGASGDSDYVWIIDPLDGTTNYLHGFPVFCVSIALAHKGRVEHAAVYDPLRQEIFSASRGQGALLDGRRIRVSGRKDLERSLIGTGFPYRSSNESVEHYMKMLAKAMERSAGIRRPGAAALDLCYVAAGRLDAFWETGLMPWDLAAGTLLIREAGGIVSALDGAENFMDTGHVLCGTPKIYSSLAKLFAEDIKGMFAERDAS
jgi:myo-inositol-1(or 4)-monophosphatase